jgi:hypothetical protein
MTSVTVGVAGLAILFTLIGFGMPIGFAMGLVGFAGFVRATQTTQEVSPRRVEQMVVAKLVRQAD